MVRVLDSTDPARTAGGFADVDSGLWWAPFTDRLAELGVTTGCGTDPLRFCPNRSVTRAQTATFLVRAFGLEPAADAGFTDSGGNTHEENIDTIAAAGITVGCGTEPLRYCPNRSVTRGQMATFLARALNLDQFPASDRL